MVIPDEIEAWEGWRAWKRAPHRRLGSMSGTVWQPGRAMHAKCKRGDRHPAPDEDCTCGIYSADSLEHLMALGYAATALSTNVVIGSLSLWGTIIVADLGFRAEYAYPYKLYVPPLDWRKAKPLEDSYHVPVHIIQRRK